MRTHVFGAKLMKSDVPQTITDLTWSHSALEMFNKCPRQYQAARVTKEHPPKKSANLNRGNAIHSAIEHYLKGDVNMTHAALSPEDRAKLQRFRPVLDFVKHQLTPLADMVGIELPVVFDKDGKEAAWFSDDARVRAKFDHGSLFMSGTRAHIIDWKTGKKWDTQPQKRLYAWLAFRRWPEVTRCDIQFAYIDLAELEPAESFTRDQMPELIAPTIETLKDLLECHQTDIWPMTPNRFCKWCDVLSCPHNIK